ncbi:MAG: hypothetical protein SGI74_07085 [Oligoflexia bacterium]|nr:hypothetical protein [Oligoflexia bacterium]
MGNELFKAVTGATGLPSDLVANELSKVLSNVGIARDEVTLEELRLALAEYLREVIIHAKDKFDEEGGIVIEEVISPEDLGKE